MKPVLLSVVGRKGSGKSEVIVRLISDLKGQGYRIGLIKHLAKTGAEVDQPGKETFEYRSKGAEKVMLSGKKRLAIFANLEEEIPLSELLEQFKNFDLVFLEGYFLDALPKIEVHRKKAGHLLAAGLSNVIAVCSDEKETLQKETSIPCFSFAELQQLAYWISCHCERLILCHSRESLLCHPRMILSGDPQNLDPRQKHSGVTNGKQRDDKKRQIGSPPRIVADRNDERRNIHAS